MDASIEGSENSFIEISRTELYDIMKECPEKCIEEKFHFLNEEIIKKLKCSNKNDEDYVKKILSRFKSQFKQKWEESSRKESRFIERNGPWLDGIIKFPTWEIKKIRSGRPSLEFSEASERSKRRKTQLLREEASAEELTFAAQMSQRSAGRSDISNIIKDITISPKRASKYTQAYKESTCKKQGPIKMTPSQALAIFVEADLTRKQYEVIQQANKTIYPCYSLLSKAKVECYPIESSIKVTETCAEVRLQGLLNHTAERLCLYLDDVLDGLGTEEKQSLELWTKWGCDGSQQQQFKQKFECAADSDSNIFQSSLVPLRLVSKVNGLVKIIWQNPVPSSPRFCRPIRIRFTHETSDITNDEVKYVEEQVALLEKTIITNWDLRVKHILTLTMVDAKVCNALTSTRSTMRCYICNETISNFNKLEKKPEDPKAISFGLSILHARIRLFEFILHLSYKLPVFKWRLQTQEERDLVEVNKKRIQDAFKQEMGLLVDVPKAGFGNTNDGNTSRRFFSQPDVASRITGIEINIILRFKTILETLSSGFKIDERKFSDFTYETARQYIALYSWHPMSPTVHKILIHAGTVIQNSIIPIGQLSEEAAEARNKHFRRYRQRFSRKSSRELCNRDVLNRLLLSSDPFLSCSRKPPKKKKPFSKEAREMLVAEYEGSELSPEDTESIDEDFSD